MFNKIEDLKLKFDIYKPLTKGEVARLREEFVINFIYNSNAIEGNTLTLQETALILKEGVTINQKSLREHLEVVGHKDAFDYIEELVKDRVDLKDNVIKDIHSIVLMDKPQYKGRYRRIPVKILESFHELAQPYLVPTLMEQLIHEYSNEMKDKHVIEKVSLFHLRFESIHPFIDGNGRTGRLLLNLELMKEGYPPINIKLNDKKKYYGCFTHYHANNEDPSLLVNMVSEYIEEELEKYISILEIANDIDQDWDLER